MVLKNHRYWALVLAGLVAVGSWTVGAQTGAGIEKDVLQAMYAEDQADDKRDRAAMERLVAADYLYHSSAGAVLDKAQNIADTMKGGTTWTARKYDGLKVRVYGDVGIVTGTMSLAGNSDVYRAGPRLFTRLFIRRDGRWQSLGGQATLIPAK